MNIQNPTSAAVVAWEAPGGVPMSLAPVLESGGTLEAVVPGCTVVVHDIRCRYTIGHPTKPDKTTAMRIVGEVRITLPVTRCQVIWSFVEMPADALATQLGNWGNSWY